MAKLTTTTSRRAVLAGAAAIPALSLPAVAAVATPDPVFAAIERHKAAALLAMQKSMVQSDTPDFGPEHDPEVHARVQEEQGSATDASYEAAYDLTLIEPTTPAGIVALIDYVEAFNEGKFRINDEWHSFALLADG